MRGDQKSGLRKWQYWDTIRHPKGLASPARWVWVWGSSGLLMHWEAWCAAVHGAHKKSDGTEWLNWLWHILFSWDITLLTNVHIVNAVVFPVVMYGCESWTIKKAEPQRNDAFELWWWRRLLRVPWTAGRSNQSIRKEISPEYSLEGLLLKVKCNTLATWCKELIHWKDPEAGKDWRQEEKGMTEDKMVGWHHQLNGHEFEQTLGDGDGQRSLACCSPWGCRESDTIEQLNHN